LSADTVMTQFKNQLGTLMKGLALTQSRYVRCVKPNTQKRALVMEHQTTMEQLKCAGVIAAVLISRSAYPSKLYHGEVVEKYGMLNENKPKDGYPDERTECEGFLGPILEHMSTKTKDGTVKLGYAMGKSRAYFRAGCLEFLESERSKIWDKWAIKPQKLARGFLARCLYLRLQMERDVAAATPIQAFVRMRLAKKRYDLQKEEKARGKGAITIQCALRVMAAKIKFEYYKKNQVEILAQRAKDKKEKIEREYKEAKEKAEKEAKEAEEKAEKEAKEAKEKAANEAREKKEKAASEARELKEKAEREEKEAKEKAEKEAKEEAKRFAKEEQERKDRELFELRANSILTMQCALRVAVAKNKFGQAKKDKKRMKRMGKKSKKSAIRIQAAVRGFIQRPKYKEALLNKKEEADLANQLDKMQDKLQDAEDQRKNELEDAKFQFEQDMEEYKEKLEDQLRAEAEKQNKSAQQQTLIDESGKIIEYLRKENMKLRQQCESMKRDYRSLKENNARLMEANASASGSFAQLNEHAKGLNNTNARLIKNVDTFKKQLVKMKNDLKNRQAFYLAEAHARVAYQRTLARIVAQVQDKSKDAQLVEDVVIWALECEAESKSERSALENAGQKAPPGAIKSAIAPKKSNRPSDSDSDSDSD
jgi:myosin heavy subunit